MVEYQHLRKDIGGCSIVSCSKLQVEGVKKKYDVSWSLWVDERVSVLSEFSWKNFVQQLIGSSDTMKYSHNCRKKEKLTAVNLTTWLTACWWTCWTTINSSGVGCWGSWWFWCYMFIIFFLIFKILYMWLPFHYWIWYIWTLLTSSNILNYAIMKNEYKMML